MNLILSVAIAVTGLTSLFLVLRYGSLTLQGSVPVPVVTFLAILFTSGLDVGLIMFPLVDFQIFVAEPRYAFTNPLALEFGFWGFLVWGFYFLTTFYFCVLEPRLALFEIPLVKWVNNLTVIGTCAFTGYLLLRYLPDYIAGITEPVRFGLVALVIVAAVLSSTQLRYVKALSLGSSALFFLLIVAASGGVEAVLMEKLLRGGPFGPGFSVCYIFAIKADDRCEFFGRGAEPNFLSLLDFISHDGTNLDRPVGMSRKQLKALPSRHAGENLMIERGG